MPGAGGQPGHGGADEVRQPVCVVRALLGDVGADQLLGCDMKTAGGLARLRVVAARAFQHQTAGGGRVCGVAAGGLLQHVGQGVGQRAGGVQELWQRDGPGLRVAVEDARVQAGLAAEGGVETGRVDAQRLG